MAQDFGIGRIWALALTTFISIAFFLFRRSLGELFAARLIRFLRLPSRMPPKLIISGHRNE